jgi:Spy/CpxP family protein refolding chaperone
MKKWQIAISILLVFAIGTAAGAYGSRVIFKKRISRALSNEGSPGIRVIQGMMERLDLSDAQRASIKDIINENNEKWETIRQEYEPKIKELYETVIEETKKELTDEQRAEIETMSAKVQRRLPRRNTSPPRSSSPMDGSGPPSMAQPFGQKSDSDLVTGIMEQLQLEKKTSAEVQSIIEADLQHQQALGDKLEKSQAAMEKKFQKEISNAKADTEKKLEKLLTPEQMEAYRRMMTPEDPLPEEPRPDNFGDDFGPVETRPEEFGFDGRGDGGVPKDFNQGDFPTRRDGQPGDNQSSRSI